MLHTTLRQIEVFVATARLGNLTQAAASIGLSQSAASTALADFEHQLGTRLFDRLGKRLQLNDEGRALTPRAVELLARAHELEDGFGQAERAVHLRLGASSTIGNYLLPPLIGAFRQRRPGSRLDLEVGNTGDVLRALLRFEIDVGFIEGPCADPDIDTLPWRDDRLAICVPPGSPLAQPGGATVDALREADWILRERGSGTREVVEQLLTSQLGQISVAMELGGTEAIKRAVESGMGISCLSTVALTHELASGSLCVADASALLLQRPLSIVLHKQKYRTAGITALLDFLRQDAYVPWRTLPRG